MKDLGLALVSDFHRTFDCHIHDEPEIPIISDSAKKQLKNYIHRANRLALNLKEDAGHFSKDDPNASLVLIRLQLMQEELAEVAEALLNDDLENLLKEMTDLSYVVDGTYLTFGLHEHKEAAYREVHRSNLSKLDERGEPIISKAGRVMKGPHYQEADMKKVLGEKK